LKSINFSGNPIADEKGDELKKEVLILLGDQLTVLSRLNKDDISAEDKKDALDEKEVRRLAAVEEKERLDAERVERLMAEA
jgi:hypothetical protein